MIAVYVWANHALLSRYITVDSTTNGSLNMILLLFAGGYSSSIIIKVRRQSKYALTLAPSESYQVMT